MDRRRVGLLGVLRCRRGRGRPAGGIRFNYGHTSPVCGPSRCQFLTGQYPFRSSHVENNAHARTIDPHGLPSLARVLKSAGYATALAGKWHMSKKPEDWGFDESEVLGGGSGAYWIKQGDKTAFKELDRLKPRERALVIFAGDDGAAGIGATMKGRKIGQKRHLQDGGATVPLIAHWPGTTPAGKVCDDLVGFEDFLPTFAELAGAAVPKDRVIDGIRFAPRLRGEAGRGSGSSRNTATSGSSATRDASGITTAG